MSIRRRSFGSGWQDLRVDATIGAEVILYFGRQPELDLDLPPRAPFRSRATGSRERRPGIQALVHEFHQLFELPIASRPQSTVDPGLRELRIDLLVEEVTEYVTAARHDDTVALADALADIVYVAYGAAISYGIDLDRVLEEVHRANLTKLGGDGRPRYRADGKVLKGPGYSPPAVRATLLDQPPLFSD